MKGMRLFITIALAVIGMVIVVVSGVSPWLVPPEGYTHSNKLLLDKSQYQEFKATMSAPGITELDVDIISSDYLILVRYSYYSQSSQVLFENEVISKVACTDYQPWMLVALIPFILVWYISGER